MDLYIALVCVLIVLWILWRKRHLSLFQQLDVPGPQPNIICGNLFELYRKGPLECHKEWVGKYGRVLGYYYGMTPVLLVTDPDLLKNIFIKDFPKFMNRESFGPLNKYDPHSKDGQSVLILPGQAWKLVRGVLTPTFTTAKMKQMAGSIDSSIDSTLKILKTHEEKGDFFDIYTVYQRLTLDVITKTAFGIHTDIQTNEKSKMLVATSLLFSVYYTDPIIFIGVSFPYMRKFCTYLQRIALRLKFGGESPFLLLKSGIVKVLELRRKDPKVKASDLLQLMIDASIDTKADDADMSKLEAGNTEIEIKQDQQTTSSESTRAMSEAEVTSSAFVVLLAGYETTSTALALTSYLLAKHPHIQQNLYEEIRQLIQSGEKLEYSTLNKLPYLDKVLNESLRMLPPVNLFTNRYALEDVEYENLKIPKDMLIQAPVYTIHHDPEFWPDPEQFDPERFATKPNSNGITFLPFGVGPRNCLGMRFAQMEAKLALANVIRNYHLELSHKQKVNFRVGNRVRMLFPEDGVQVKITRRKEQ